MELKRSHGWILVSLVAMTASLPVYGLAPEKPINKLEIPGYVSAMEQSPDGRWVYVMVENKDESGIYVLDAQSPSKPRIARKFKLKLPLRMRLSRDGQDLYVLTHPGSDEASKRAAGLYQLDLSDPSDPKIAGFSQSTSRLLAASNDDKILATDVQQDGKGNVIRLFDMANRSGLKVVTDINLREACPQLETVVAATLALSAEPAQLFVRCQKALLGVDSFQAENLLYDLSIPSRPKRISIDMKWAAAHAGQVYRYTYTIGRWNNDVRTRVNIYLNMSDDTSDPKYALSTLNLFPNNGHDGHSMFVQEPLGRLVIGPGYSKEPGKWQFIDVTNPKSPRTLEEHILVAPEYIAAAKLTKDQRYLYVTSKDGIWIFQTTAGLDIPALVKAHASVLRDYRSRNISDSDRQSFEDFVVRLERADVGALRDGSPAGMSVETRAAILNDYAYFMRLSGKPVASLEILERVISIQPDRAVAHLNTAEAYRDSIVANASPGRTEDARNKITLHYRKYQQLTKRNNPEFDKLVRSHLSKSRPTVCQYLTEYVNRGRLDQITIPPGWMDINDDGRYERTALGYGMGTMGGEIWSAYNVNGDEITLTSSESESGPMTFGVKFVPYAGSYYILNLKNERSAAIQNVEHVTPDNRVETVCTFTQEMVETISDAKKPGLCKSALEGKLQYVSFDKTHGLTIGRLGRWASAPGAAAVVDIDNDGISENLLEIGYMSSAGRGCDFSYLDMLNAYRSDFDNSPKRQLLLSAQGVTPGGETGHTGVPACGNSRYRVFRYEGKYYLEGKYGVDNPSTSDVQFHNVVLIEKGTVQPICKFNFQTINK